METNQENATRAPAPSAEEKDGAPNSQENKPAPKRQSDDDERKEPPRTNDDDQKKHESKQPDDKDKKEPEPSPEERRRHRRRLVLILALVAVGLGIGAYFLTPVVKTAINTISTDDAYVNSHVTFVAPRVAGQVARVLVDDNMRVEKGALLAELDKEPYRIQVRIRKAAVESATMDVQAARAQVRGLEALARSQRWQVQMAIDQVRNKVATLRADVASYESKKASRVLAEANLKRGEELVRSGGVSKEDLDQRRKALQVADAEVEQSLQMVYADRVYLGLPEHPPEGQSLNDVPSNVAEAFPMVRSALASFLQTTSQIGLPLPSTALTPDQVLESFRKRDSNGDIDRLLASLVPEAPAVKQSEAKLLQARRDLEQAELNLIYCDIVSEIDGIVSRRNVNPGNNIQVGQSLMAIRSLHEMWVDANFKETQLRDLRIGQRVVLDVDMYGSKQTFEGRITGFSQGTGSTLSLLPAQNATGNFVKVVQRLPVRIELTNYDPDKAPLYDGLSVTPYVYFKEPAQGPHAGDRLQSTADLPIRSISPSVNTTSPPGPVNLQ